MKFIERNAIFDWFNITIFSITFLILLSCKAHAADTIAIGDTQRGLNNYLSIGDFNLFDPSKTDSFGLRRYGLGQGQWDLGSPMNLFSEANSGVIVHKWGDIALGAEVMSGMAAYNNTGLLSWRPGLSLAYNYGNFYIGPRVIYTVSNNVSDPSGYSPGAVAQVGHLSYWLNKSYNVVSYTLNDYVNIENRSGVYFLMLKKVF